MWRAFFLAVGISLLILGGKCLVVERVVLSNSSQQASAGSQSFFSQSFAASPLRREVVPPDWAAWSLMSAGAVVIIYSFTIPKRVSS